MIREVEVYKLTPTAWPIPRVDRVVDGVKVQQAWAEPRPRSLEDVVGVTLHVTGVGGGFGVTPTLAAQFRGDLARARLHRYCTGWGVRAYHAIASPRDRASYVKLEAAVRSHHGNGLNSRTIGWAYDGLARSLADLDVDLAQASLIHTIRDAWDQGCTRLRKLYAHRQSGEPGPRAGDPGQLVWSRVAEPVARYLDLEIDYEWTIGAGLPIGVWRPAQADTVKLGRGES